MAARFTITVDEGFISRTRSIDKQILQRIVDAVGDGLAVSQVKSKRRLGSSFRNLLNDTVNELKRDTPKDSGRLAMGWTLTTTRASGKLEYNIVNKNNDLLIGGKGATLLDVLEYGTKPTGKGPGGHTYAIYPKKPGGALSFRWDKRGGARVAFRMVNHPGIYKAKNPFVGFIDRARRRLRSRATTVLQGLATRI